MGLDNTWLWETKYLDLSRELFVLEIEHIFNDNIRGLRNTYDVLLIKEMLAWYGAALYLLVKWPIILQDALQMMLLKSPNSHEELKLMVQRLDISVL